MHNSGVSEVSETAQKAVNQSKSFLGKQVDERTTQLGQQIENVAKDIRNAGDQLRQNGIGAAAGYVDRGADVVEQVGRYLEHADSERLVADLEGVARRQPWTFAAGALALGFATSRFLKTSSSRRYRRSSAYDQGSTGDARSRVNPAYDVGGSRHAP